MLILVACTFVFLHLMQLLAKIWQAIYPDTYISYLNSPRNFVLFYLFVVLGYHITGFQNSINFFLYSAFCSKVRKVLSQTLC